MTEIIKLLQNGVALYEKLVGVTREKTTGKFTMGQFHARQEIEAMDEALSLDPTGVTAVLLLRYYTEQTVASRNFNWLDLLRKPELASQLDLPREILSVVESPLISEASDHFQSQLTKALRAYGVEDRADVMELLSSPDSLAFLRRDALRSMENLQVDQFLDGNNDPEGTLPVYAKVVHQWWNINSMLEHLTILPSGVSLNLIREPDGYSSYFAFAIRNGSRLFVLSDVAKEAHPLQNLDARRPDRDMERRIARNWFPYDLLNLKMTEDGRRMYLDEASKCTSLAVRQSAAIPLKSIIELNPETLVWVLMMLELIVERFWKQDYRAPALSYTGEMIRQEASLLTVAEKACLPAPIYENIGLTPISKAYIQDTDAHITAALGHCPVNQNQWMLDRYGEQCSEESLNLLAMPSDVFLLDNKESIKTVSNVALEKMGHFERQDMINSSHRLHQLRATSFGTKDKLDKDRIWLARYNWATQVQAAADKEFESRKAEVFEWYKKRLKENLPNLLNMVGHESLWRQLDIPMSFGTHVNTPNGDCYSNDAHTWVRVMRTVSREEYKNCASSFREGWWQGVALPYSLEGEPLCAFTDAKSSYTVTFYPLLAEDIAFFAGCAVSELPDVLQHFYGIQHYTGNSILSRIDPAVTQLNNPWLKLDLRFRIGISKRGMKQALAAKNGAALERYHLDREERQPLPSSSVFAEPT